MLHFAVDLKLKINLFKDCLISAEQDYKNCNTDNMYLLNHYRSNVYRLKGIVEVLEQVYESFCNNLDDTDGLNDCAYIIKNNGKFAFLDDVDKYVEAVEHIGQNNRKAG